MSSRNGGSESGTPRGEVFADSKAQFIAADRYRPAADQRLIRVDSRQRSPSPDLLSTVDKLRASLTLALPTFVHRGQPGASLAESLDGDDANMLTRIAT